MGDEGFVGRGNRMGGLITPFRPYTMEGICGKNPVYHTGKVYSVAAWEISKELYKETGKDLSVMLVGQSGHSLSNPWNVVIAGTETVEESVIDNCVERVLKNPGHITERIIAQEYPMF
jgi:S-adenosylmethionine synthetase